MSATVLTEMPVHCFPILVNPEFAVKCYRLCIGIVPYLEKDITDPSQKSRCPTLIQQAALARQLPVRSVHRDDGVRFHAVQWRGSDWLRPPDQRRACFRKEPRTSLPRQERLSARYHNRPPVPCFF